MPTLYHDVLWLVAWVIVLAAVFFVWAQTSILLQALIRYARAKLRRQILPY